MIWFGELHPPNEYVGIRLFVITDEGWFHVGDGVATLPGHIHTWSAPVGSGKLNYFRTGWVSSSPVTPLTPLGKRLF